MMPRLPSFASAALAGLVALAMTCPLGSSAAAAVADADPKLLDEIQALVTQASDRGISPAEMERLHARLSQAEDQVKQAWQGASLAEINDSRTGKLWKEGNSAILAQMQRRAATGTGTLGFLPSGKSFTDVDFDPRTSDFDATVLGPRSGQGVENFVKAAPGDFLDRRKFTVMSGDGNFYRYRGGADTAGRGMTEVQIAAARQKVVRQMGAAADAGGGYLSRGAVAGLEASIAEGKYAGKVTFVDSTGKTLGQMHVSRLGSLAERFGVVDADAGDLLGMATDNQAQFANYLSQKGNLAGSAKIVSRQASVIDRLPDDLKRTLKDDPAIRKTLRDADAIADALKKGADPAGALKAANVSAEEFVKQAESVSRRVIKAAGDDLARRSAAAMDPALRTGGRLMLEQNVLGAIVNAGGIEKFRAQHAGNQALLALAGDVEKSYGGKAVAGLADRRQQALSAGLETAARKAGVSEKVLAGMLDVAATSKAGARTARGVLAGVVAGVGIDAAIATYHLSNGNYEDAAIALAEGGASYAMPAAGVALLARDLTKLSMQFAVERFTGGYRDKRLQQTWEHIQNVVIADHYEEFAKSMVGHADWQTPMPYAEELLQEAGGFVRFHGLEAEVQRELAQQLFAIRHDVWRQYVTAKQFELYLQARAYNEAYDRKREQRIEGEVLASLQRDDAATKTTDDKAGANSRDPEKDKKDKPGAERPDRKRAWDQPQQQQQALAPGGTAPPPGSDRPRAWDNAPGAGKPAQPERPQAPSLPQTSGPTTGTVVPWAQATERSVCLAYQNLALRQTGEPVHARLKGVQNLHATVEAEVRGGRCLLAISGQWYEYPDGRTIRTIGNPLQSVTIEEARRTLEKLDPTSTPSTKAPAQQPQQTQSGSGGADDCAGVRGAPRPNLPGPELLKWIRCNNVDPARR